MKYNDIDSVLKGLADAQEADFDIRENVREAHHFLDKRDGQWEPEIIQRYNGKPRYTFDKCNPIVDQVAGELDNADFTLKVRPTAGANAKENAEIYDGLIMNIRNISNFDKVSSAAARSMIAGGMDGWEVVQGYVDADAFDQDLFIRKVHNWVDRVWFDPNSMEQDHSDAKWVIVLNTISMDEYKERFPKHKSTGSIGDAKTSNVYSYKPCDTITIGKILYKKPRDITIILMNNGDVYQEDEKFLSIVDELAEQGIVEEKRRTRKSWRVHSRIFNNDEWLTDEEETVFDLLPVCATYGNYKVSENKRICRGIVEKLIDPQRVLNYALSRDIEEGALSPRGKYWATTEQVAGHTAKLATLNTNSDPLQEYNHAEGQPPPFWQGGAQVNQGLQTTAANMSESINSIAGLFSSNMGDNPGLQSGVAIDRQISKGDNGTTKWFDAVEIAMTYTGRVLIPAIARTYDATRQVRLLYPDGSMEMKTLNRVTIDKQTGQRVELNNLSNGQYDVVCEVGSAFKSKQRETAAAFAEIASIDPTIMEIARDVWFKNLDAPGMDVVAERSRQAMITNGQIPEDQLTEEEKAKIQEQQQAAANQPPQEDPMMVAARAEENKAQAAIMDAQNKQQVAQMDAQVKMADIQLRNRQVDLDTQKFIREKDDKYNVDAAKIQQGQVKIEQDQQKLDMQYQSDQQKAMLEMMRMQQQELNDSFKNLKTMLDAMGATAVMSPQSAKVYSEQVDIIDDKQEGMEREGN